ncbi:MAG: threonine dehydratase [Cyanobacteria bacterium P01_D01_bin.116]
MQHLTQLFENTFIRVIAVFSVLFRTIFGFLQNIFNYLSKTLGISNSDSVYFVDDDIKQSLEQSTDKSTIPVETVKNTEPAISSNRRIPKSNMDDFMKMAKEISQA